jgi:hypothetical protein
VSVWKAFAEVRRLVHEAVQAGATPSDIRRMTRSSCDHDWLLRATVGCPGWECLRCHAMSDTEPLAKGSSDTEDVSDPTVQPLGGGTTMPKEGDR